MPISATDCFAGRELSEPRLSPDARRLAYVRADQDSTRVIVRDLVGMSHEISSPWDVRSGRGLGGGCFEWIPDGSGIVAVDHMGDLRLWNFDAGERRLVEARQGTQLSSPTPDPDGRRIAYVVDRAEIREFDIATGRDRRVDRGDDAFVLDPTWWRGSLVWQAWSPPHMPWDESALVGERGPIRKSSGVQYQQLGTSVDGDVIGWIDDESGWLNVVIDGVLRVAEAREHAGPTWGERQRTWCFDDTGNSVAFVRNEDGFGRLCTVDVTTGRIVERAKAVHGQLSWKGNTLAAIRTGGRTPTQVVVYDTSADEWTRSTVDIGSAFPWSESQILVEPELLRIDSCDSQRIELHARLYRCQKPRGRLLCWIHGGPTDQWQVTFMPRFAYWFDRGYDVLVPDFRGSTGHGRQYTQALNGRWGSLDVDDVRCILDTVSTDSGYPPESIAVLGSSAGGLTALCSMVGEQVPAAAVVAAYPVSDIAALDGATHRFEAHYNRSLMGSPDDTARLSTERSPLALIADIARVPILVLHGSDDPVVPISQSEELVAQLRSAGADVEFLVFDGEGHGFRKLENKVDEFARTEEFLERYVRDAPDSRHRTGEEHR